MLWVFFTGLGSVSGILSNVCVCVCVNRKKLLEEEEAKERLRSQTTIVSFCVFKPVIMTLLINNQSLQ